MASKVALVLGMMVALVVAIPACAAEEDHEAGAPPTSTETTTDAETQATAEPPPPPPPPPPVVARVVDGDTLRLDNGTRIRLLQVDAPERGECYFDRSRRELVSMVPRGSEVRIAADPRLARRDAFGRRLGYVFAGRRNINVALVRRGAAAPYFFESERGRFAARLLAAARQARTARRGLWAVCSATELNPLAPLTPRRPPPPPPPPPPPTAAPQPPPQPENCHPSYEEPCLDPNSSDYDCEGGSGNGPDYTGPVRVVGPDDYGLDADGDGRGCEDSR